MILNVTPHTKPRMTVQDRWKRRKCVLSYFDYRDKVRDAIKDVVIGDRLDITFLVPMPKSWSKKKRLLLNGKPKQSRADLDNYIKGLLDATHEEDATVWDITARKLWTDSATGSIIILNKVD